MNNKILYIVETNSTQTFYDDWDEHGGRAFLKLKRMEHSEIERIAREIIKIKGVPKYKKIKIETITDEHRTIKNIML